MGNVSIVILEELSDQNYILKCIRCNGSGKFTEFHKCSFCNGRGKVLVKLNGSLPFVKCGVCDGSGRLPYGHSDRDSDGTCNACLGVGAQPITGTIKLMR